VRAIDPASAPAGFVDRVLAAAAQPAAGKRPARRVARGWPTLPLGAAALLVVGGLAVLLFRGSPGQQRAVQRQPEPPPVVTAPAPSREPTPPPAREPRQTTAAPAPPTSAAKRAETTAEPKLSDEQRNLAPPPTAERFGTKSDSSKQEDTRDAAQERGARRRSDAAPSGARDRLQQAPASPARDRQAAAATAKTHATPRDVIAQLRVANVSAGERALIALAARVGGRQTGRRVDAGWPVVELTVPREAYAQFVRDATALGALSIESQTTERPMLAVAITVSS
jgi:outer membrane biosynthesis protein TonB